MKILYLSYFLREIVALLLNNLKETKLKIYKSVFVAAVVSSELFKHRGESQVNLWMRKKRWYKYCEYLQVFVVMKILVLEQ